MANDTGKWLWDVLFLSYFDLDVVCAEENVWDASTCSHS